MPLSKEREIIRIMAETILDRVHDSKADTETMLRQCEEAVKLARAESESLRTPEQLLRNLVGKV